MIAEMLDCCRNNNISEEEAINNNLLLLELCEVKKYWDVSWGCKNKVIFCTARKFKDGPVLVFISLPIKKQLTISVIESLQETFNTETIILVIQQSGSTSLYYELSKGLLEKSNDIPTQINISDSYIRSNKKFLFTIAQNKR